MERFIPKYVGVTFCVYFRSALPEHEENLQAAYPKKNWCVKNIQSKSGDYSCAQAACWKTITIKQYAAYFLLFLSVTSSCVINIQSALRGLFSIIIRLCHVVLPWVTEKIHHCSPTEKLFCYGGVLAEEKIVNMQKQEFTAG